MSALPKAVQKQIADANALLEQSRQPPAGEPPAPPNGAQPPAPPAPPANQGEPPTPPPAPPQPPSSEEGWEKRYRVLQGKYNAEVPRLQSQVKDQNAAMERMQNQLNLLMVQSTRTAQPAAPAEPPAPASNKLVKDEEVKAFGADLIDVVRRVAREEIAPVEQRATASVDRRVRQTEQSAEAAQEAAKQAAFEKMMTLLAEQVPTWEQMNADEEFIDWLSQMDHYAGATRQSLLNHAFNNNDGPRVVAFFKGYQTEHAALNPPPAPPAPPAPEAQQQPAPGTPLERLIAPGTAKSGAGSAPNEASKRIWTNAEIHAFNQKRNQLVVARKPIPPAMVETEKEILAAAREGRVRA